MPSSAKLMHRHLRGQPDRQHPHLLCADAARHELDKVLPTLEAAQRALNALNKNDIIEIRTFTKPPVLVQLTMEGVCILLQVRHAAAACGIHAGLPRLQALSTYLAHLILQGRYAIAIARVAGWPLTFILSLPMMTYKASLAGCCRRNSSCLALYATRTEDRG